MGEGQQIVRMLVTPSAGTTIGPNAWLVDQSQGSFQGGPPVAEFIVEVIGRRLWLVHQGTIAYLCMHIL